LFVFEPSMAEYRSILEDVQRLETLRRVGDLYEWPDMQYLTLRWSGRWTNVDLRFSGFNGYPDLSVLYGTHFGGLKPWYFKREKAIRRWGRYDDFQAWFREYTEMVSTAYPDLLKFRRLARLLKNIQELNRSLRDEGLVE
jgi:glycogenin glucosyltransferase